MTWEKATGINGIQRIRESGQTKANFLFSQRPTSRIVNGIKKEIFLLHTKRIDELLLMF